MHSDQTQKVSLGKLRGSVESVLVHYPYIFLDFS